MRAFSKVFTPHYYVEEGDCSIELKLSWGKGTFEVDGQTYELRREGLFFGAFELVHDGEVLARGEKRPFGSFVEIDIGDYTCTLHKTSIFGTGFGLYEADEQVGSIARKGWFTSEITADLEFIRSLPVRIFVLWLFLRLDARDDASADE